jgi:hypothetical protein
MDASATEPARELFERVAVQQRIQPLSWERADEGYCAGGAGDAWFGIKPAEFSDAVT